MASLNWGIKPFRDQKAGNKFGSNFGNKGTQASQLDAGLIRPKLS